jgi:hypothetical protein
MSVLDSNVGRDYRRFAATGRGKRVKRWPDRVDQRYLARIFDEGRLTMRDEALLDWLVDVRCATAEQIARTFFNSDGTAKNRLTQLYRMRMVERAYFPPADAAELGISPFALVYYLGRGGKYWLQQIRERTFENNWKVQLPQNVAHDLMSTELMAALQQELRQLQDEIGAVLRTRLASEVLFWKLDESGHPVLKTVKQRDGREVREKVPLLRSDMRFEVKVGEGEEAKTLLSAFVEADRGRMDQTQFAAKVQTYNQAAEQWRTRESVREAKGEGVAQPFPWVLVVGTSPVRARNLAKTVSNNAADGVMWAVVDWQSLGNVQRVLLEPIWWKAAKGRVMEGRPMLPTLAQRLGVADNGNGES